MASNLKESIQKAYLRIMNEDRLAKLDYQELQRKGGKPLPKGDATITRVEVAVSNIDIPGMASSISSFAKAYKTMNEAKKKFDALKKENLNKFLDLFLKFFNPEDALLTRVIKTAGYAVSISKAGTREGFDKEKFIELLKENFKESTELIDKLTKECVKITDVAATIDIEANEATVVENKVTEFINKTIASIKSGITSFITYIKDVFKKMDSRLDEMNNMLSPEQKEVYADYIKKYNAVVTETDICELDKITEEDNPLVTMGLRIQKALEKTFAESGLVLDFDRPELGFFIIGDDKESFALKLIKI